MDRRAFMALLGLGPAFKRLVPAVVQPLSVHMGVLYDEPALSKTEEQFWNAVFTLHLREHERHRRYGLMNHVVPYAAPPEESQDA